VETEEEATFAEVSGEATPFAGESEEEVTFAEMSDEVSLFTEETEREVQHPEVTSEEVSSSTQVSSPTDAEQTDEAVEEADDISETTSGEGDAGAPFAFTEVTGDEESILPDPDDTSFAFTEVESASDEPEAVPEVPFGAIEEADEGAVDGSGLGTQEEQEMTDDLQLRQEETPVTFERGVEKSVGGPTATPRVGTAAPRVKAAPDQPVDESRPTYHKYLKPDDELLEKKLVRARPTGFDQDLETDAGEIDFGIDLIDPHERKKKPIAKVPKPDVRPAKGGVGGHDADAEVGTRELGNDIGVDYNKRRKRRL
jgi:hypothetical protein